MRCDVKVYRLCKFERHQPSVTIGLDSGQENVSGVLFISIQELENKLFVAYRYSIYLRIMIRTYRCRDTEKLAAGYRVRRFVAFERVAQRKIAQLDAADTLGFLRVPPGNRLEALTGDREGQYSIRINDQWRLCFRYDNGNAYEVEIVDYH